MSQPTPPYVLRVYPLRWKKICLRIDKLVNSIGFGLIIIALCLPVVLIFGLVDWLSDLRADIAFGVAIISYVALLVAIVFVKIRRRRSLLKPPSRIGLPYLIIVEPGQHARLNYNNQGYVLDQPGCYVIRSAARTFFIGTEEEWEWFDPLSL